MFSMQEIELPCQTLMYIKEIEKHLKSGDSINVARKKVCGNSTNTMKIRYIMHHPEYVRVLNEYLRRIKKPFQYELISGKLITKKKCS